MAEPLFASLRLVGGTSLALQYGHRSSVDLDFFGEITADDEVIKGVLRKFGSLLVPTCLLFAFSGCQLASNKMTTHSPDV